MLTDARDGDEERAYNQHVAHKHGISGRYVCLWHFRSTCSDGIHAGHDCRARSCEHIAMISLCQIHKSRYQDRQVISPAGFLTQPCLDQPDHHQTPSVYLPTVGRCLYLGTRRVSRRVMRQSSSLDLVLRIQTHCKARLQAHMQMTTCLPHARAPCEAKVGTSVINGSCSARAADLHAFRPMTEILHKLADSIMCAPNHLV